MRQCVRIASVSYAFWVFPTIAPHYGIITMIGGGGGGGAIGYLTTKLGGGGGAIIGKTPQNLIKSCNRNES